MKYFLVLLLCGAALSQDDRTGRFFNSEFWKSFGKGIDRVADDLEVAIDQLGTTLKDLNRPERSLSDRLNEQIDSALPVWLRSKRGQSKQITKIEQSLVDGVDDGLIVYYDNGETVKVNLKEDSEDADHISAEVEDLSNGEKKTYEVEKIPNKSPEDKPLRIPDFGPNIFRNFFRPFSLGGSFGGRPFSSKKPWWRGDNVCVDKEEIDEGEPIVNDKNNTFFFFSAETTFCTNGDDHDDYYRCTTKTNKRGIQKTVTVTHRCCHGFTKENDKCVKMDHSTLSELMEKIGANYFKNLITTSDLNDIIDTENLTLFVPTDEAVREFTLELEEAQGSTNEILDLEPLDEENVNNNEYRVRRSTVTSEMVKALTLPDILYASRFSDEQTLQTKQDGATLRVNIYSGIITANCARVITVNQKATNGVIHTIDRVVPPVTKTIFETVNNHQDFTILNQLLALPSAASILEKLKTEGQLTLLAPTDAAFNSLPETTLSSILKGEVCLDAILKNHLLPNVICSAALGTKSRTINLLDEYLVIDRDEDDKLSLGDSKVLEKDIMATNGVIYVIDKPLIPNEAKPIMEVLSDKNLTMFMNLLEEVDMIDEITSLNGATIFAPSNNAFMEIMEDLELLKKDKDSLKELIRHHITSSPITSSDVANNHLIPTMANHPLRLNLYSNFPLLSNLRNRMSPVRVTAGCSKVSEMDNRACGGVVHVIEQVLSIPKKTVMERISEDAEFSIFNQILVDTELSDVLSQNGSFTILAPSDHVFKSMPEEELTILLESIEHKKALAQKHILKEHICCSGINSNQWLFMNHKRAMDGSSLHVHRNHNGRLMAGPTRITDCGSPDRNGVVHKVNHLLHEVKPHDVSQTINRLPQRRFNLPPHLEFILNF